MKVSTITPIPIIKATFAALLSFLFVSAVFARDGAPPRSASEAVKALVDIQQLALPATDVVKEVAADAKVQEATPLRYAVPVATQVTPNTHGTWEKLPEGRLWRLRVVSDGATDLNFGFTTFWLPDGATLHVISETQNYFQGPYTAQDNQEHGQLWTPVTPGPAAVIELFVPANAVDEPRIVLTQVGCGYRDLFRLQKDTSPTKSGSCEIMVACPVADPWRSEIRSVARYSISGNALCTGTLVMDSAADFRSYFLTANHCGLNSGNAASVVVYWNYESTDCNTQSGGSLAQNQSGATFRASKTDVDFALIELSAVPSASFNVYYAGWDRSGSVPNGCVGIHHPNGDTKAISFSTTPLTTINSCIGSGGSSTHWYVQWSSGVTEPGSSGSGIWNPGNHLLVGTLSGGNSACGGSDLSDCYGKFSVAWASGSGSTSRLSDWLDAGNTGVTTVAGQDPRPVPVITILSSALAAESCAPTNGVIDAGETVTLNVSLKNSGTMNTANLVATLLSTNGVINPGDAQNYGALAASGGTATRSFVFTADGVCGQTISPTFQLQDGTNNLASLTLSFTLGAPITSLSEKFDGVTAPSLPSGWTSFGSGTGAGWATTTAQHDTLPNSAFASDPSGISDSRLTSIVIPITTTNARVSFRHYYNTESGYDGGALEISVNGGAFSDIVSSGGSFTLNGYTTTLSGSSSNPLAGRQVWSGTSGGFVTSQVNLPASAVGKNIQLRWRLGSDSSVSATGWYVDSILVSDGFQCCHALVLPTILNPHQSGTNINFSWNTMAGQSYIVETRSSLGGTNWTARQTNTGDGTMKTYTGGILKTNEQYFRIRAQ